MNKPLQEECYGTCWGATERISEIEQLYSTKIKECENYKTEYNTLRDICIGIYYARIAMRNDLVVKGLEELDWYFREPNMN